MACHAQPAGPAISLHALYRAFCDINIPNWRRWIADFTLFIPLSMASHYPWGAFDDCDYSEFLGSQLSAFDINFDYFIFIAYHYLPLIPAFIR